MKYQNFIFIISSPSGAGKTTIAKALLKKTDNIIMSVSVTTRGKREGEIDGKDYHFINKIAFNKLIEKGDLLEYAQVFDNYYGTPKKPVIEALDSGKDVLFDIDWQGAKQMKEKMRKKVVSVYILPPSMRELEERLNNRGKDSKEVIALRMAKAQSEISHWKNYDYVVVNDNIDECLKKIESILNVEKLKRSKTANLVDKLLQYYI